jgi:hypothetical protein
MQDAHGAATLRHMGGPDISSPPCAPMEEGTPSAIAPIPARDSSTASSSSSSSSRPLVSIKALVLVLLVFLFLLQEDPIGFLAASPGGFAALVPSVLASFGASPSMRKAAVDAAAAAALVPPGTPFSVLLFMLSGEDDPTWFSFYLNTTAKAMRVPYAFVVSTRPGAEPILRAAAEGSLAAGRVFFSESFDKKLTGDDLLRGLVNNLELVRTDPVLSRAGFTHGILLASNMLWIRPITRASYDAAFSGMKAPVHLPIAHPWAWLRAAQITQCIWDWAGHYGERLGFGSGYQAVHGQWEGLTGPMTAWGKVTDLAKGYLDMCSGYDQVTLVAEEVVFHTSIALAQGPPASSGGGGGEKPFSIVGRVYWESPYAKPDEVQIRQAKADPAGPLAVKRVERNINDGLTRIAADIEIAVTPPGAA